MFPRRAELILIPNASLELLKSEASVSYIDWMIKRRLFPVNRGGKDFNRQLVASVLTNVSVADFRVVISVRRLGTGKLTWTWTKLDVHTSTCRESLYLDFYYNSTDVVFRVIWIRVMRMWVRRAYLYMYHIMVNNKDPTHGILSLPDPRGLVSKKYGHGGPGVCLVSGRWPDGGWMGNVASWTRRRAPPAYVPTWYDMLSPSHSASQSNSLLSKTYWSWKPLEIIRLYMKVNSTPLKKTQPLFHGFNYDRYT